MIDLGIEHKTARALYDHFKQEAHGGQALTWRTIPDWTGIWTREAAPFFWDPDQTSMTELPTAKLTPDYFTNRGTSLDHVLDGFDEHGEAAAAQAATLFDWFLDEVAG